VSKERLSLGLDFVRMNTEISNAENVARCIGSIRRHLKFYQKVFRKQTRSVFKNLTEKCNKAIIEFNIDNIQSIKGIIAYQSRNLFNLDNNSLTHEILAKFKHKIELNFHRIDEQSNDCSDLIRKTYYGLKCISCLIDSNQNQDDKVLSDIIELTVHFLDLLFKKKLIFTNCLTHGQMIDLMNIFCLFNKFNIDHFQMDNIKKSLLKLKDYNKIWYEYNREQMRLSESALILYNFTQMSLNIQNETLIVDLFEKIRSLDDLKEKFINMDKVFNIFLFLTIKIK
jgi:hypothetical protein